MTNKIDINKIFPDPEQPRQFFDEKELKDLKDSITKKGICVPLNVESNYNGDNFLLLDGERRYRCAKELDLKEVPITITEGPLSKEDRTFLRFHIQEQHKNWSLFDKARAIYNLKKESGKSIQEIAVELNSNAPTIHHWLSLVDFTEEAQKLILENKVSYTYLFHLSKIVKDYLVITEIDRIDIEKNLIQKVIKNDFKTVLQLQQFSRLMSSNDKINEKIEYLENKITLDMLLDKSLMSEKIDIDNACKNILSAKNSLMKISQKKYNLDKNFSNLIKDLKFYIDELL